MHNNPTVRLEGTESESIDQHTFLEIIFAKILLSPPCPFKIHETEMLQKSTITTGCGEHRLGI